MSEEEAALTQFKDFVASIEYTEDHSALAAQLGKAKAYWGEAALSLRCVRQCATQQPREESYAVKAKAAGLLQSLGLIKKIERRV